MADAVQTVRSCGSQDGRDCQPSPPGSLADVARTSGVPIPAGSVVLNAARKSTPSAGTAMNVAVQEPTPDEARQVVSGGDDAGREREGHGEAWFARNDGDQQLETAGDRLQR